MRKTLLFGFTLIMLLSSFLTIAQKKDKIKYDADEMIGIRENGKSLRRLIGNVIFKQKTSTMYCDSAIYHVKENVMYAYGHVKIVDDSVTITSDKLTYYGDVEDAKLRENVIYTKGEQRLTTDFLDYNMDTEIGNYFNKGQLRDSTNTLTSMSGYFYGKQNYAVFWQSVELVAPDYVLKSDTLNYNTKSKIATTDGWTKITTKDDEVLHANGGEFKTEIDQSAFVNGTIETIDYYMEGDEIFFDDIKQYYDAKGNVKLTAKNDDVIITGDEGYNDDKNGISKVYGNALMKRIMQDDTLYMSADTLVSIESEYDSAKRILAYPNVKVWRFNLQGLADSASYFLQDSLLYFYDDPIFWNQRNQIEGDTVIAEITEKEIKTMDLIQSAFLSSEDTLGNFNQVKGRTMKAFFKESKITTVYVNGNGESIYYVLDEDDPNDIRTMGMNRILCSDMTIRFVNEKVDNISFYIKPDAKFIPPHELTADVQKLPGFLWRGGERPDLEDLLNATERPAKTKEEDSQSAPPPPNQELNLEGGKKKGLNSLKKSKEKE